MAARRPQAETQIVPESAETQETIALATFEDLILLCEDKRDIRLRTSLKRHVRLIHFSDGRMEFSIAGNAPPNFIQDLSARLQAWTGRRWIVATSREGGGQTIDEAEQAEMNERAEQARANPAVDAIMTRFPGARIIDVKLRQPEAAVPVEEEIGAVDETAPVDPPDETGLDDFFD